MLCSECGWLKARTHQRSDSAHVLAATRTHHRLENISETLRQALDHLAIIAPTWLRTFVDPDEYQRYRTRVEHYRLPKDCRSCDCRPKLSTFYRPSEKEIDRR